MPWIEDLVRLGVGDDRTAQRPVPHQAELEGFLVSRQGLLRLTLLHQHIAYGAMTVHQAIVSRQGGAQVLLRFAPLLALFGQQSQTQAGMRILRIQLSGIAKLPLGGGEFATRQAMESGAAVGPLVGAIQLDGLAVKPTAVFLFSGPDQKTRHR